MSDTGHEIHGAEESFKKIPITPSEDKPIFGKKEIPDKRGQELMLQGMRAVRGENGEEKPKIDSSGGAFFVAREIEDSDEREFFLEGVAEEIVYLDAQGGGNSGKKALSPDKVAQFRTIAYAEVKRRYVEWEAAIKKIRPFRDPNKPS